MEQSILESLRSTLSERGLTIAQVARQAGITREALSKMLHGHKSPKLDTLCRVCAALKLTISLTNIS